MKKYDITLPIYHITTLYICTFLAAFTAKTVIIPLKRTNAPSGTKRDVGHANLFTETNIT
jgi:hypothetical protein